MSKRKFLSDTELEKILAIPENEEDEDYSSDDSVKDPMYNPTAYSSESEEDEEVINNIEEVLESLALEENREESDEEQENRVAGEPQMEGREIARKKAKRVYTYCPDCPQVPFMCLECFGNHHKQV